MDSETVLFPSEAFVICLMLLLFFCSSGHLHLFIMIHCCIGMRLQVPTVLNTFTTHTSLPFKIPFL